MILLDTTVMVYAVGTAHPLREPCRRVVAAVADGGLVATTTVEAIQELAHVRAHRRGRADASRVARSFVELLSPLVQPNEDDLDRGLQLFAAHEDVGAFDAVLAAVTMGREHLRGLMSTDRAFAGIPRLRHIDPADPAALGALLAD